MGSSKIERLLDAWLEGQTSLEEERELRAYFKGEDVAPELEMYRPMFIGLAEASKEVSDMNVELPAAKQLRIKPFWYSVAALLVVAITAGTIVFSNSGLSQEEEEALAALKQTREVMMMMSQNLNKGTENVALLDNFRKGSSSLRHIDQFSETTSKYLK